MIKLHFKNFIISNNFMNDLKVYPGSISWLKRASYASFTVNFYPKVHFILLVYKIYRRDTTPSPSS
jgi:hypothetical protein